MHVANSNPICCLDILWSYKDNAHWCVSGYEDWHQTALADYDEVAVHADQLEDLCGLAVQPCHGDVEDEVEPL